MSDPWAELVDPSPATRQAAAEALCARGLQAEDLPRLLRALERAILARDAQEASAAFPDALEGAPDPRDGVLRAFGALRDARAVPDVIGMLNLGPTQREAALNALAAMGAAAREPLLVALRLGAPAAREGLALGLCALDDQRALDALFDALPLSDVVLALDATLRAGRALHLGWGQTVLFVDRLEATDPAVRAAALRLIGHEGDRRGTLPVLERLRDPNFRVRRAAIQALGALQDPRAVHGLVDALDASYDRDAREALVRIGPEIAPTLCAALLYDRRPLVRLNAAITLGRLGAPIAAPALAELVLGEDAALRDQSLRSLEAIGRARGGGEPVTGATPALLQALGRPDLLLRAARVLAALGDPHAVPRLRRALDSTSDRALQRELETLILEFPPEGALPPAPTPPAALERLP